MATGSPRFVAYYRVSTDRQGASGLGLDAQRAAVARYVEGRGEVVAEFQEIVSGRRDDRAELARALDACRELRAVLLIARLDRLARRVRFIAELMESDVRFVAVEYPDAPPLLLHILAAVAEEESRTIGKRTSAAMRQARARGRHIGARRPEIGLNAATRVNQERAAEAWTRAASPRREGRAGTRPPCASCYL
jgi:DNA invertase Pin-like site-specific DNA recombinase